jgi:hypothetical protein
MCEQAASAIMCRFEAAILLQQHQHALKLCPAGGQGASHAGHLARNSPARPVGRPQPPGPRVGAAAGLLLAPSMYLWRGPPFERFPFWQACAAAHWHRAALWLRCTSLPWRLAGPGKEVGAAQAGGGSCGCLQGCAPAGRDCANGSPQQPWLGPMSPHGGAFGPTRIPRG